MAKSTSSKKQFLASLYCGDDSYLELDWKKFKNGFRKKRVINKEEDFHLITNSKYEYVTDESLKFKVAQVMASGSLRIGKVDFGYEDACNVAKKLSSNKLKFITVDSIGTPVD